jgi:hypothetical protein
MVNGRAVGLGAGWSALEPRLEFAQAFMEQPWGPHSSAVQAIVNAMRSAPVAGKFALKCLVPYESWVLVRLPLRRGLPIERVDERVFTVLAEAERAVFLQRWETLFGERIRWNPTLQRVES